HVFRAERLPAPSEAALGEEREPCHEGRKRKREAEELPQQAAELGPLEVVGVTTPRKQRQASPAGSVLAIRSLRRRTRQQNGRRQDAQAREALRGVERIA